MDDEKTETLDKVAVLSRGVQDDKHLSAIFAKNYEKKTPSQETQNTNNVLIAISE